VAFVLLPVSATGAIDSVDVIVGAALFLAIIAAIVFVPWDRVPRTLTIFPPLVYFGVVDLLRDATGGGASGYAALVLLPVLWVALYSGRAELIAVLAGVWSTFVIPILVDKTRYPEGDWRFAVLLTLLSAFIGFATQALVENVRLRARNLSAVMTSAAMRSAWFRIFSRKRRDVAGSSSAPSSSASTNPRIDVSGVRSSCPTTETNSSFMRSISRRSVMSLKVTTMPLVSPLSSWIGVLLNSTGNVVPSLRRKCSSPIASPCPERNSPSTMRSKRTRPSSSDGS